MKEKFYPETNFGGFTNVDGTIEFYNRVNALIKKEDTILDIGCGRGEYEEDFSEYRKELRILKGKVNKVIGIDYDSNAETNNYIDEFILIDSDYWEKIPDHSIDLILCDWVLEHIKSPEIFLEEAKRVLKKGGYFCARTTNKLSYVGVFSRLIPNKFHTRVLQKTQPARKKEDVFPTFYRVNTTYSCRKHFKNSGLDAVIYTIEPEPSYLEFSSFTYAFGKFIGKYIPSIFKTTILVFAKN